MTDAFAENPLITSVAVNDPDDPLDITSDCGARRCGGFGDFIDVELDDNVRLADKKLVVSYEQTTATSKQNAGLYIYSGIEPTGFIRTTAAGTGFRESNPTGTPKLLALKKTLSLGIDVWNIISDGNADLN